jgi:hypothetical protein
MVKRNSINRAKRRLLTLQARGARKRTIDKAKSDLTRAMSVFERGGQPYPKMAERSWPGPWKNTTKIHGYGGSLDRPRRLANVLRASQGVLLARSEVMARTALMFKRLSA